MNIIIGPPKDYFFNNNEINSALKEKGKKESNLTNDAGDGIKFLWKNIDSLELTQIIERKQYFFLNGRLELESIMRLVKEVILIGFVFILDYFMTFNFTKLSITSSFL